MVDFSDYRSLVFDCDGVLLNSNHVKTNAFYTAALPYGEAAAKSLVDYHIRNGGVSRYKKFKYFLEVVVGDADADISNLLSSYSDIVYQGLRSCELVEGIFNLRDRTSHSKWFVVSGGDQAELRQLFDDRGIACLFEGGIFGSPETKDFILNREIESGNIGGKSIFFGDSKYDHQVAIKFDIDFIFVSGWSEFGEWKRYCCDNKIVDVSSLSEFLI